MRFKMFSEFMITGFCRRFSWIVLAVLAAVLSVASVACDRVALLAPAGSTITLTPLASSLPLNGSTNIIAQVIEPAGTPPNRGTLVTFTTTLGTILPIEVETDAGGRVIVTFRAGTQSGTATIFAHLGGCHHRDGGRSQDPDRCSGGHGAQSERGTVHDAGWRDVHHQRNGQ